MTTAETGLFPLHVAGIVDADEAEMLIDCGVGYLGFPLVLDCHREDLNASAAAAIVARFADRAMFSLITYLNTAASICELCRTLGVDRVQVHGDMAPNEMRRLREMDASLRIVKSLIVRGDNVDALAREADAFAPWVDGYITDTFDPETGATGATGKTHDWMVSHYLVRASPKPVILAGGLNADNVREAIGIVRPAGVDVHTGIEGVNGRKRRDLTERFIGEARAGFDRIGNRLTNLMAVP